MGYNPLTGDYTPDAPVAKKSTTTFKSAPGSSELLAAGYSVAPSAVAAASPVAAEATPAPAAPEQPAPPAAPAGSGIDFGAATAALQALMEQSNAAATAAAQAAALQAQRQADATASLLAQNEAAAQAQRTNWIAAASSLFKQYNVEALGNKYTDLITKQGYDDATAMLKIQSEPEWQQRFAGNTARLAQGLTALSPSEYLATEDSYKAVLRDAGISASVYNDPQYMGDLIAKDVSPVEVQQRVNAARVALDNTDPFIQQQLQQFGLTKGDMILHLLDPKVASSVIQQRVSAAEIGGEAARQGLAIGMPTAQDLAAQGVTQAQAAQGFRQMAGEIAPTQELAARFGTPAEAGAVGGQLQSSIFNTAGAAQAEQALQRAKQKEVNLFSASAGVDKTSLGANTVGAGGSL